MRLWRSLALIAFYLVSLAPPASAGVHSAAWYRASYQHYRGRGGEAWSHYDAVNRHGGFAFRPWRHGFASSPPQPDFTGYQSFDDYNKTSAERFGGGYFVGRYEQRGYGAPAAGPGFGEGSQLQGMAEQAASANGIPVSLVNRVIRRESGGNSRAVSRGNYGLMQIRLGTARAMGYSGSAAGLLDPATNMTYAVRYLGRRLSRGRRQREPRGRALCPRLQRHAAPAGDRVLGPVQSQAAYRRTVKRASKRRTSSCLERERPARRL
jgi:hypothetical protein